MRKVRDVKFIIYQALYIFVICIVAIKGANLDLKPVMDAKDYISEDSLRALYEIIKTLRFVDTNHYVIISKDELERDKRLAELYKNQPPIPDITGMVRLAPGQRITTITPEEEKKIEELRKEEPSEMTEIRIGSISLTQFTLNTLNNPYDVPLEIVGVTTIPPKSTKTFETGGQASVVIRVGTSTKTVELKPNIKPKISFQRITSMGEETRVTSLQSSVCYRVTVDDDFPGQLDIKFTGPISFKQVSATTFDVTMNAFSSRASFDNFTENKDSPYSLGFTVSVSDKIAGHKITGQNSFIFGEW
jgi:hypothetical protein